ncbi:MFS transporter [Prauserella sp. PE36]|uniref:MFS transporter n=1 Tax=Prauserella endophytica TaxID=1592324 RepID=A0ABY2RWU1_9PSEU|nr:MFS transporter [Prauserella sp. PE36]TKG63774.1 MFS transporter [Prauserella endophytica]
MLADVVPLYPLYALLFADTGLSDAEISALFAIWSVVGIVVEVPTGALADRFSRKSALVAGGVLQAAGYALWTATPGFTAFAAGFVLWGLGGSLVSGSVEALLYDGLVATGAQEHFTRIYGQVGAFELIAQIPAAVAATVLFPLGGYELVGWASVATCLTAAFVASRVPEPPRTESGEEDGEASYLAALRTGVVEAVRSPAVRGAVVAVALLTSLDGIEEYFPLLARDWHVPVDAIPLAVVAIPLAGAAGSALAGRLDRLRPLSLALVLLAGVLVFALAGLLGVPLGLVLVGLFYAAYRAVLVVANARLQERIDGTARATVTSVAGLGTDLAGLLLYAAWAVAGLPAALGLALVVVAVLPFGLRGRSAAGART